MDARNGIDTAFAPGKMIADRYELMQHLGKGAMGFVVRAVDRSLDNESVAIKLLYPHLVSDVTIFARFRNEVLLARRLSHPNIVRIYDFGKAEQGYYFISMEYVSGASVKDRLYNVRYEPLRFDEVLRILYEIGQGMAHAHRQGVIHRDLKPDNIMLTDRGEVKITDFGLARQAQVDKGFTQSGETVGTPCYMAPEQIRGERVDPRADIYSMGIMAYEMVTGEKPFDDDNWLTLASMHLKEPLPDFPKSLDLPPWFVEMVEVATAKDPADRYQSAEEWCEVLSKYIFNSTKSESYTPAVFSSFVASVQRKSKRRKIRHKLLTRTLALFVSSMAMVLLPPLMVRNIPALQAPALRILRSIETSTNINTASVRNAFGISFHATPESLANAVKEQHVGHVRLLLAAGVDPNTLDEKKAPLFQSAIRSGNVEVVREFLKAGINVNQPLKDGELPLFYAMEHDPAGTIVGALITSGAQITALNSEGQSPLMRAVQRKNLAAVQQLLAKEAFVNVRDKSGTALLHSAIRSQSLPIVQAIVDAGARLNDLDKQGLTPLMIAARLNEKPIVEFLLLKGADPLVKNSEGKTARDFARGDTRALITNTTGRLAQRPAPTASTGQPTAAVTNAAQTRLRVISEPQGVWERGKVLKIRSVSVSVRNAGEAQAQMVAVHVQLPNGKKVQLNGPERIEPNATAQFKRDVPDEDQVVRSAGDLKAIVDCANCRTS